MKVFNDLIKKVPSFLVVFVLVPFYNILFCVNCSESTYAELVQNMKIAVKVMKATEETSITSTTSGSELFLKVIGSIVDKRRDEVRAQS